MVDRVLKVINNQVRVSVTGGALLAALAGQAAAAGAEPFATAAAASAASAAAQYQDMLDIQALGDDAAAIAARLPKNSVGTDLSNPVAFRGGAMIQRIHRFDVREDGASGAATGAENRAAFVLAAARAADAGPYGVMTLGYDPDGYDLERFQPAHEDLVLDGNGATIRQAAPTNAASLAIGGVYSALGAILVGPEAHGFQLRDVYIEQDGAALAALPLAGAGTTWMGPLGVRRANRVKIEAEIAATIGPGAIWRGGNEGLLAGALINCRAVIHAGFENDPFAGDAGGSDESPIYTPLGFEARLKLFGSPIDVTTPIHFHMTGGNDFDLDLNFIDTTDDAVTWFRAYCNDYGLFLADGTTHDTSMRGRAIIRASGTQVGRAAIWIEGKSQETGLDTTAYECPIDLTGSRYAITGDETTAKGRGIELISAPGVHGKCNVRSWSSCTMNKGQGDRLLTGEYRCTGTGINGQVFNTDASAVLGKVILPGVVGVGPGCDRGEDFNAATGGGPTLWESEAPLTIFEDYSVVPGSDASQGGARMFNTANMRGPAILGDILVKVFAGAGPSPGPATGIYSSFIGSVNNGTHPFKMGKLQVWPETAFTKGVAVNTASHFEADMGGLPLKTSHAGTSEIRGLLKSSIDSIDAFEQDGTGEVTLYCPVQSTTTSRAMTVRDGVVRFAPGTKIKALALTSVAPLAMTGGVAVFYGGDGAFEYSGSGAPILFVEGGKVRGDLGSHANLNSTGTPWSDSNRLAATDTITGTRFVNSNEGGTGLPGWNISNGTSWHSSGTPTAT